MNGKGSTIAVGLAVALWTVVNGWQVLTINDIQGRLGRIESAMMAPR